ncbi:MAG TPA: FAD-dependent oxidoreductase [Bacteroidales bacterium]|nr:FAD-dependent oxidoreductase [Bacteroidales bacterium]
MTREYDFLIIGGGIFGVYSAIYLARKGYKVCLLEKEDELMLKASIVNQARLHAGYHYPRSIATAEIADEFKERFTHEHKQFINFSFDQYYAIDKYNSFTDSHQFERFCKYLGIKHEPVDSDPRVDFTRIERLYLTTEYSFDPIKIADYYRLLLKQEENITCLLGSKVLGVEKTGNKWKVKTKIASGEVLDIIAASAINATYSGTNTINRLFEIPTIKIMHEITEMAMVSVNTAKDFGLTVMDGQFMSVMPYGLSGLHSLSSVAYTVHKVSYDDEPTFHCQLKSDKCTPSYVSVCNLCEEQPASNKDKMLAQAYLYLNRSVVLEYKYSMFTIKSKLASSFIDDGRPTEISKLGSNPDYFCLFAGKINSIYEIEKFINYEL